MSRLKNGFFISGLTLFMLSMALIGYGQAQPKDVNNICEIFEQYPTWYIITQKTQKNWKVPIHVQMAVMWQESRFIGTAKLGRQRVMIDHKEYERPISYGYSQAEYGTWLRYEHSVGIHAKRTSFAASSNFVGWYVDLLHRHLGLSVNDPYSIYLAYHEGIRGYLRKSYDRKPWLIRVAHRVAATAEKYAQQLRGCEAKLASIEAKLSPHESRFEDLFLTKKPSVKKTPENKTKK